jgi:hypothetical protein
LAQSDQAQVIAKMALDAFKAANRTVIISIAVVYNQGVNQVIWVQEKVEEGVRGLALVGGKIVETTQEVAKAFADKDPGLEVHTYSQQKQTQWLHSQPVQARNPKGLRLLRLTLEREPGEYSEIRLLRSLQWLENHGAKTGKTVKLDLPEMGVSGHARVKAIETCPPLGKGQGCLVTGTFKHSRGIAYDLKVEGQPRPIGVTPQHPFLSARTDRTG